MPNKAEAEKVANVDRMLKWFEFDHLPEGPVQETSKRFNELAHGIVDRIQTGPERTVALRELLKSKDAAVRATIHPGG